MGSAYHHQAFRRRQQSHAATGGFTLIELLAASLLAALMMAAIFGVLTSCFADVRQLEQSRESNPSIGLLREQLRRDIQNATGLQISNGSLTLFGYVATDPALRMPTLARARVDYRLVRVQDELGLVRHEQTLAANGLPGGNQSEVVWVGLGRLEVIPLGMSDEEESGIASSNTAPPDTGGLPPAPPAVRVTLFNASLQPILRDTIVHHREF